MRAASDTPEDRQLELLAPGPPRLDATTPLKDGPRRCEARDRVTIDLRGLGPRLRAHASNQRKTPAALMRKAVRQMLDCAPDLAGDGRSRIEPDASQGIVKVTLRISRAHSTSLADRARAADVAQGDYVCALLDGAPPLPRSADHTASVAVLMTSTDRLAAMSSDLNAFLRLLGRAPVAELEGYRAGIESLAGDVRAHLACAAALIAELRPAPRPRR